MTQFKTKKPIQVPYNSTPTVRTSLNYFSSPSNPETYIMPSLTKPDMSYTPQELLIRHSKGLPLDKLSNYSYHGDIYLPEVRSMDLTEQAEMLEFSRKQYADKQQAYDKKRNERKKQAMDNKKAFDAFMAKQRESPKPEGQ